eukprot:TRINITY_DN9349_c0_g1_i4.p1 TRINITY_DN9349_c0_g1~~TRINITY_DN9349_c0_g1_i4.p1  ORF type:complete len:110 (+),score=2.36 TRINITY_DN9349_c0_g1_i4:1477-1806(+)
MGTKQTKNTCPQRRQTIEERQCQHRVMLACAAGWRGCRRPVAILFDNQSANLFASDAMFYATLKHIEKNVLSTRMSFTKSDLTIKTSESLKKPTYNRINGQHHSRYSYS